MTRRPVAVVAVVLIALAGCGVGGGPPGTRIVQEADDTANESFGGRQQVTGGTPVVLHGTVSSNSDADNWFVVQDFAAGATVTVTCSGPSTSHRVALWDGSFAAVDIPAGQVVCDGAAHQRTFGVASTGLQLQYLSVGGTTGQYDLTVTTP
jgi:hypothetical protein